MRNGLERPDTITASAVSAREQISQVLADKIREMKTAKDLERVAEDVLPHLEKFLESPEEKRLRRVRAGVVTAASGLGASLLIFFASFSANDLTPFIALGLIAFFVGLGLIINGFFFTVPLKGIIDRSEDAVAQKELESRMQSAPPGKLSPFSHSTNDLPSSTDQIVRRPSSVTEHTTHQLKPNKS